MTKIQNSKPQHHLKEWNSKYVWVIGYWNLRFICNLVLGNRGPARRVGCPKDQFDILQCPTTRLRL